MIWLILIIILAIFVLPMFFKNRGTSTPATAATPSGSTPGGTPQVTTQSATVGPLASLLGNTVGTVVSGAIAIPRNLISGIFKR